MTARALTAALFLLALAGCVREGGDWNKDQQAVFAAMQRWAAASSSHDTRAMWDLLSPDAQDIYRRELEGRGGARETVTQTRSALAPEALTAPEDRRRLEALLLRLPPEPDRMQPFDYFDWRVKPGLTPEATANTARLLARANVARITIDGDAATVELKHGEPISYRWRRVGGDWRFDLMPAVLQALQDARAAEGRFK